jgi:predicted PurR-regulated permease PerM
MPDLLILLSTLGGISMFGAVGLVVGPVLAAVCLTLWELYGIAFADVLPAGRVPRPRSEESANPDPLEDN